MKPPKAAKSRRANPTAGKPERVLRFILGDQLSPAISSLKDAEKATDIILIAEVMEEATYVGHHKKKLAFLFSAMRHFAEELRQAGFTVDYVELGKEPSFDAALKAAIARHKPVRVVVTEPGEWRVLQKMRDWVETLGVPVEIREDDRFICSHEGFRAWAGEAPKHLRMEFFYREMRKRTGLLMQGDAPEGGAWNFDHDNRKRLPKDVEPPKRPSHSPDATTGAVLDLVEARFANNFGTLEGFDYPVTREQAEAALDWFVDHALPSFGDYQDAMKLGEPLLFHSHLSALINCGLLDPMACCRRAERAFHEGDAPLNAVEGFIRQILGWREFVRGVYWLKMPDYADSNAMKATRPLPDFFWTGRTDMACLAASIGETIANAYAHHIQRLMVIGNFCLLAGLDPREVQEWYLLVYHDAYEWVEMPNVVGMILYADGGLLASKPYVASGAYINRMSDYCGSCAYSVKKRTGKDACPFNHLYWSFMHRHRKMFAANQRMKMMVANLDRIDEGEMQAIRRQSDAFLKALAP